MVSPTAWQTNGAEWGEKNPVGTGPFTFVEWVRNTRVVYEKYDSYWQEGKPYLDGIVYEIIPDATVSEAAFRAGDVDVTVNLPALNADNLKKEGSYIVEECGAVGVMFHSLYTDGGNPDSIFADVNVRKALGYAIDREKIVKSVLLGYGKATNQKGLPGEWGYNPDMEGQMYDPAKAKEMLTLAGHPNGIKTTLTVMAPFAKYMEAVQSMLIESDIEVELRTLAPEGWRHEFEVGWDGILHCIEPPSAENAVKFSLFTSESAFMPCLLRPPEIETLMAETRAAADFETKQELIWEAQAKVYDEYALQTPLWIEPTLSVNYPYVHNAGFMKSAIHESTPEECWRDK
jgi:ABC-type transport system substrate-binding protein